MTLERLIGKRILNTAGTPDYSAWAETLLSNGHDSKNLAILAGFQFERHPYSVEVDDYFHRCLEELNIQLAEDKFSFRNFAQLICEDIISGEIKATDGLNILYRIYTKSEYDQLLSIFDFLDSDICAVNIGDPVYFNSGLTKENQDEYITRVAKQFYLLLNENLPKNFFSLSVCEKCLHTGTSKTKRINFPAQKFSLFNWLKRSTKLYQPICAQCGTPNPLGMGDYKGRKLYFEQFDKE